MFRNSLSVRHEITVANAGFGPMLESMADEPEIKTRCERLAPFLNERTRRRAAAAAAVALGRGGIALGRWPSPPARGRAQEGRGDRHHPPW
jgi:hypothetical protein